MFSSPLPPLRRGTRLKGSSRARRVPVRCVIAAHGGIHGPVATSDPSSDAADAPQTRFQNSWAPVLLAGAQPHASCSYPVAQPARTALEYAALQV